MNQQEKESRWRTVWLTLSVILAAVGLFGAVYWGPQHDQSTTAYWGIFAFMAVQSYALYKKDRKA